MLLSIVIVSASIPTNSAGGFPSLHTPSGIYHLSVQFSLVTQSCLTRCNPMDCPTF